jgi:aminobenzoyl-glutamate utilization protein B
VEDAPGHGEGHNSGLPLVILSAIEVKKIMEREKISGKLMIWPGVAEELVEPSLSFKHTWHTRT